MSSYKLEHGDGIDYLHKLYALTHATFPTTASSQANSTIIITDPPYGLNVEYDGYNDTEGNLEVIAVRLLGVWNKVARNMALFTGVTTMFTWNKLALGAPDWVLSWVRPAGNNRSKYGFQCWTPILAYGKDPFLARGRGARPDTYVDYSPLHGVVEKYDHPCSKPTSVMTWLIQRMAGEQDVLVIDPFCGTGSTGVACAKLGLDFIGIEQSAKYCAIAEERLALAYSQKTLFEELSNA